MIHNATARSAPAIQRVMDMDHVDAILVSPGTCAKHAKSDCTAPIARYPAHRRKPATRMADAPYMGFVSVSMGSQVPSATPVAPRDRTGPLVVSVATCLRATTLVPVIKCACGTPRARLKAGVLAAECASAMQTSVPPHVNTAVYHKVAFRATSTVLLTKPVQDMAAATVKVDASSASAISLEGMHAQNVQTQFLVTTAVVNVSSTPLAVHTADACQVDSANVTLDGMVFLAELVKKDVLGPCASTSATTKSFATTVGSAAARLGSATATATPPVQPATRAPRILQVTFAPLDVIGRPHVTPMAGVWGMEVVSVWMGTKACIARSAETEASEASACKSVTHQTPARPMEGVTETEVACAKGSS